MKRFLAAAVSAAILFASAGCGKEEVPLTDSSVTVDSQADMGSTITDDSTETEKKTVKAAALSQNAAKMWLLAGGQLVAVVREAEGISGGSEDMVILGTEDEPSVEDIMSVEPDVILVDKSVKGYVSARSDLLKTECEILEVSDNSFKDYDASMKLLTDKTGNTDAYRIYVEEVAERNQKIINNALEAAHQVKVTVTEPLSKSRVSEDSSEEIVHYAGRTPSYVVIRVGDENCRAMSNEDYICSMLHDFGMSNANKSGQQVIVWKQTEVPADESVAENESTEKNAASMSVEAAVSEQESETTDENVSKKEEDGKSDPSAGDSSVSSVIPEVLPDAESVDSFAAEIDKRDAKDAGRRTFENLLANNPDFIFIVYEGDTKFASQNCKELVKSCENWEKTFAVQSGRVYELSQNSFGCQPNELWDLAYEYLYQTIFVL